ncbi:TetR/AcrR family transcriptional regulator [Amycolatopsis sp. NPDC004378]
MAGQDEENVRSRDADRTREALLEAAGAEFAENAYDEVTARRIAARAGVNQSLVFRYFGSKRNLYELVLSRGEPDPAADGEALLLSVLRRFLEPAEPARAHPVLTMLRSVSTADGARAMREQMVRTYLPVTEPRSDRGWSEEQRAVRAELAWAWILGIGVTRAVVGLPALVATAPDEVERIVRESLDALLEGAVDQG